jgi:hypothetical protein
LAGAIGTAVAVSIMTAGMNSFMKDVADKADTANGPLALTAGIQNSFIFAIVVAIVGLFFALSLSGWTAFVIRIYLCRESAYVCVVRQLRCCYAQTTLFKDI